jgi:anthranilate phosphoribosyltransferase
MALSMMRGILAKLAERQDLTREEAQAGLGAILEGKATPAQIAGFATGLRVKGETIDETVGCVQAMREAMVTVTVDRPVVLDTCGTGGDGKGTYNISTVTAFVAAAGGITVAKHGNRAASSRCGSADLLEAFGVKLDPPKAVVERCLAEVGIGFLFAPLYHPALKHAGPVRRELGFRTIFNLLGPLCNPARANTQVLGVPRMDLVPKMGKVLHGLGVREAYVFHSEDGLDELSPAAPSTVAHVTSSGMEEKTITPEDAGMERNGGSLTGGLAEDNARAAKAVLNGEKGAYRDAVVLNAAACLVVGGVEKDLRSAAERAVELIDSGKAREKLDQLRRMSHEG